ncbi:winged helix-turn-helix transcriptional regulator [Candidatus Parcubacteria bacterium]|nr:winged helix-turn-helix transcriptional regulator [Candidatus Parcubacteria bacterium]
MNDKEYEKIIKAICNTNRKDIIVLLKNAKTEMCVNHISKDLEMSQSLTSQQLKYLEARDIVYGYRVGKTTCYKLCSNDITKKVIKIINILN